MKGRYLSFREEQYIYQNATMYHYGYIARRLGELYPEDNGGTRSRYAVYNLMKKEEEKKKK